MKKVKIQKPKLYTKEQIEIIKGEAYYEGYCEAKRDMRDLLNCSGSGESL